MQVTQLFDPFNLPATTSKRGIWIFLIVAAVIGGVLFYFYRQNKISLRNSGLL